MSVLSVWRAPFSITPEVRHLPEGTTLAEMVRAMPGLPHDFGAVGVICLSGRPVYRSAWGHIRPKAMLHGVPVEVTFHAPPLGGGGRGGGKRILTLVASIALSIVSGGIAANGIAALGIKGGTFLAKAAAVGTSLAGTLLIGALSPPPVVAKPPVNEGSAAVEGNALEANGAIPRVFGERKLFPPLACEPLTYFEGRDEVVEAVYALAGPHRLSDIRFGRVDAAAVTVEIETREGWPGDAPLSLVTRQSKTEAVQAEIVGHRLKDSDDKTLEYDTGADPADALPQPQIVATRVAPDEHWLHLVFPQGLNVLESTTTLVRMPLRLRMRALGDTVWRNLPELHIAGASVRQLRLTVRLVWSDAGVTPAAASGEGFIEARRSCPAQVAAPADAGWTADATFGTTGDAWMAAGNLGSTGVQNVSCDRYTATIRLDPDDWPRGRWEIEVTRGATFRDSEWVASTGQTFGSVWNHFTYQGSPGAILQNRAKIADQVYLLRSVSVWSEHPVPTDRLALVAVRARNRSLQAVSVVAGGWVPDWDGAGWNTWAVTGNPAPHLRDIYRGALNAKPVPASLIDEAGMVAWRSACATAGWTVNHVSEDESVFDAARIVAACGYGQPRMSDAFGVVRDYDRSAEAPVQVFTPRNSRGLRLSMPLPDLPDGFRANYRDRLLDYEPRQIVVARPGFVGVPVVTEQIEIAGLVDEADVVTRALYDLSVPEKRPGTWTLEAPVEALVCRRGDLVGVTHDMITRFMGAARITDWTFDGSGDVDTITLDSPVPVSNEPEVFSVSDFFAVADVFALGIPSGVVVRGPSGPAPAVALTDATGETAVLHLAVPMDAADVAQDALVAVGLTGTEMLRLVVSNMRHGADLTATLELVDEGAGLFA